MIGSKVREKVLLLIFLAGLAVASSLVKNVQRLDRTRGNINLQSLPDPAVPLEVPEISKKDAAVFLVKFGYGDAPVGLYADLDILEDRIRAFQRESFLRETGELDHETKLLMATPRCGLGVRSDQTMFGGTLKWTKSQLTYNIASFPNGQSSETIRNLIRQAFYEWSNVTNLDFREVQFERSDIRLSFGGVYHSSRGGQCSFEMPSVLAHAFFPPMGEVHFNTRFYFEANWPLEMFLNTAVHEIGHALGLPHVNSIGALMYPTAINGFTKPQPLDVQAIQQLYGARVATDSTAKVDENAPSFCSLSKIDAAIQQADDSIAVFAGDYFYNPESRTGRRISSKWPGLPGNIDAAFHYGTDWTFFFKGTRVWCFKGTRLIPGYPRPIGEAFPGVPDNIDAALIDGSGNLLVFRADQFWAYDSSMKQVTSVQEINLPTDSFDAGLNTRDQMMLFKGRESYQFGDDGRSFRTYSYNWFMC